MHVIRLDSASARYRTPLVVRASLPRTFWSLGAFVELGLFSCGFYLLAEASLEPLKADGVSILGAGVILALASVLLFYMIRPRRREALTMRDERRPSRDSHESLALSARDGSSEARRETASALLDKRDLPGPM
jgi:hypothetical protein